MKNTLCKDQIKSYEALANNGDSYSAKILGDYYSSKIIPEYEQALMWYTLAAKKGNTDAMHLIGTMYETGQIDSIKNYTDNSILGISRVLKCLETNKNMAYKYYKMSADAANITGIYKLGSWLYAYSDNRSDNESLGIEMIIDAAKKGQPDAIEYVEEMDW